MRYRKDYWLIPRKRKAGGVVWHYLLPGEKTKHTTGRTKKAEAARYVERLLGISGGRETIESFGSGFFLPESDYYRRERGRGVTVNGHTQALRQSHLDTWILPGIGRHLLADLSPVVIERWLYAIPRSAGTRNSILSTLRIILTDAVRQGRLKHNPALEVKPVAASYRHRDVLTLAELHLLFPPSWEELVRVWNQPRFAVAHLLMASAGMRLGETAVLPWARLRLDIPAVLILEALKADDTIGPPKSGDVRAALLPERAAETLKRWRAETPYPADTDYVVPSSDGGHCARHSLIKAWHPALERAGIDPAGRYLGSHCLRHTYVTRGRGRLSEEALRYMVGHSTREMSDRYDQSTPEEAILRLADQRPVIDRLWE